MLLVEGRSGNPILKLLLQEKLVQALVLVLLCSRGKFQQPKLNSASRQCYVLHIYNTHPGLAACSLRGGPIEFLQKEACV